MHGFTSFCTQLPPHLSWARTGARRFVGIVTPEPVENAVFSLTVISFDHLVPLEASDIVLVFRIPAPARLMYALPAPAPAAGGTRPEPNPIWPLEPFFTALGCFFAFSADRR